MKKRFRAAPLLAAASAGILLTAPIHLQATQGWVQKQGKWLCYDQNGEPLTSGMYAIQNQTYCFDDNGFMITGWHKGENGGWYYFDRSGAMKTKWLNLNGTWYYFSPDSGLMAANAWQEDQGKWYFLGVEGAMYAGWLPDGNTWYYLDHQSGAAKTGWLKDRHGWYYLYPDGKMATDSWIWDSSARLYYYVDGSGLWMGTSKDNPASFPAPQGLVACDSIAFVQNQPVKFLNYGWIVQVDNQFGLIRPDGTWMYEPEYEQVQLVYVGEGYSSGPNGYVANFYKTAGDLSTAFGLSSQGAGPAASGFGGTTASFPAIKDGIVQIFDGADQTWTTDYASYQEVDVNYLVSEVQDVEHPAGKNYYIWNAQENRLFGPYAWNFAAYAPSGLGTPSPFTIASPASLHRNFHGVFSSQDPQTKWSLNSSNAQNSRGGYVRIDILDPQTALGFYMDGSFDVLDENCQVLYTSIKGKDPQWILGASNVVYGKTLVKRDGIWYFMAV